MTVGSTLFLVLSDQSPVWWLAINLSVLGFSNGFNNVGLQTALFQVSPQEIISAASGLFQTARYMGTILSTVLLGVLFGNHLSTNGVHLLGIVLAVLGLFVIWMSWRLPKKRQIRLPAFYTPGTASSLHPCLTAILICRLCTESRYIQHSLLSP